MYVQRLKKWFCHNRITEYKTYQDEVNAQRDVKLTGGWFLGETKRIPWYLDESNS